LKFIIVLSIRDFRGCDGRAADPVASAYTFGDPGEAERQRHYGTSRTNHPVKKCSSSPNRRKTCFTCISIPNRIFFTRMCPPTRNYCQKAKEAEAAKAEVEKQAGTERPVE